MTRYVTFIYKGLAGAMTKLHDALLQGRDGAALTLLNAGGIDINAQDDIGRTALMLALAQGQNKVAKKLLEQGARTELKDKFNHTALECAREGGNEAGRNMMFRRLDEAGVQREMFHAVREGDLDALTFLVEEMNAKLNDKSSRGKTALEEAEVCTHFDTAAWIEEKLAAFPDDAAQEMRSGARNAVRPMKPLTLKK